MNATNLLDKTKLIPTKLPQTPKIEVKNLTTYNIPVYRRNQYVNNETPVLVERLCELPSDILQNIFSHTNFNTLLALRLTTKKLNEIISQNLNIALKIDANKIDKLLNSLLDDSYKEFVNKIYKFDFSKISINENTIKSICLSLNIICNYVNLFPHFTTLVMGNIEISSFHLQVAPNNLTDLTIGDIEESVDFQLSNEFNNLISLTIGKIDLDAICAWPNSLSKLQNLTIRTMAWGCLTLLDLVSNLKVLTIQTIDPGCTFILPDITEELNRGNCENDTYILPDSLHSLEALIIQNLDNEALLRLSGLFNKLTTLIFQNVSQSSILELPGSFDNLTSLIIENIDIAAQLKLSGSYNNLKTLTIGTPYPAIKLPVAMGLKAGPTSNITLSGSFNSLKILSIGFLCKNSSLQLSNTFDSLETLIVENLEEKHFEFPESLDNLETLILGDISASTQLEFPEGLPNLKTLKFGNIIGDPIELPSLPTLTALEFRDLTTSIILKDLPHLTVLTIGNINFKASVTLLGSFSNLGTLKVNHIKGNLTLPTIEYLDYIEDREKMLQLYRVVINDDKSITISI